MPQFTWTGRDAQHQLRSGMIDAASALHAADALASMSLVPVAIMPFPPPSAAGAAAQAARRPAPITTADRMEFARQMHTLLRAGVRLPRAFTGLAASTANRALAERLEQIATSVDGGLTLAQSLSQHNAVFDEFWVALVQQGELDGDLASSFKSAYLHEEFRTVMREQLEWAARYPALLAATAAALGTVGLGLVVPAAMPVMAELDIAAPPLTQGVLAASRAFADAALWLWIAGFSSTLIGRALQGTPSGRRLFDALRLWEPLAGPVRRHNAQARVAGALALGQRNRLPMVQSLALAARQAGHAGFEARAHRAAALLREGHELVAALAHTRLLPPNGLALLQGAEDDDARHEALVEIAQDERAAADEAYETLQRRFEVLLWIVMAAWVLPVGGALLAPLAGIDADVLISALRATLGR